MPQDYVILCLAAAVVGAINAIAGGGTLLTFPALFAALGTSPEAAVIANATSTVALMPGSLAALAGYRREIQQERHWARALLVPSLIGGFVGSLLVVLLPDELFKTAVPWLILTAALLFALQPQIARWTGIGKPHPTLHSRRLIAGGLPGDTPVVAMSDISRTDETRWAGTLQELASGPHVSNPHVYNPHATHHDRPVLIGIGRAFAGCLQQRGRAGLAGMISLPVAR